MKVYEIAYVQIPDQEDPRGYHYKATKKREVLYDSETGEYRPKKGAKWVKLSK